MTFNREYCMELKVAVYRDIWLHQEPEDHAIETEFNLNRKVERMLLAILYFGTLS